MVFALVDSHFSTLCKRYGLRETRRNESEFNVDVTYANESVAVRVVSDSREGTFDVLIGYPETINESRFGERVPHYVSIRNFLFRDRSNDKARHLLRKRLTSLFDGCAARQLAYLSEMVDSHLGQYLSGQVNLAGLLGPEPPPRITQ